MLAWNTQHCGKQYKSRTLITQRYRFPHILGFRAGNKGYAYTFITPEQERYSGDLIRAFELAGVPVPEQLRSFFEGYKAKQLAVSDFLFLIHCNRSHIFEQFHYISCYG